MKQNALGNYVFVTNDPGRGVYSSTGATRVTIVTGDVFTGLYAADGSLNIVVSSLGFGYYHACGAIRVTPATGQVGFQAPDGSIYAEGILAALVLLNSYSPGNGLAFNVADNSLVIVDPITPANNYTGPLVTATLLSKGSFTRASSATYTDQSGVLVLAPSGVPRIDYDPVSLTINGLFIESQRTNSFLNSPLDGTNLVDQSVTVTAVPWTISFYGTGSITLSGAHTATVTGLGAYPTRTYLTFTPTAGILDCVITGVVQYAQLELGPSMSSFIPTAGVAATRARDVFLFMNTDIPYSALSGTFYAGTKIYNDTTTLSAIFEFDDSTANNRILGYVASSRLQYTSSTAGISQTALFSTVFTGTDPFKSAFAWAENDFSATVNADTVLTDNLGTLPSTDRLLLGVRNAGQASQLNGWIKEVLYVPSRLTDAQLQELTA